MRAIDSSARSTLRRRVVLIATAGLALTVALLTALTTWLLISRGEAALDEDLTRQLAALDAAVSQSSPADVGPAVIAAVTSSSPSTRFTSLAVDPAGVIRGVSTGPIGLDQAIADDPAAIASLTPTSSPADLTVADSSLHYVASAQPEGWKALVIGSVDEVRDEAVRTAAAVALVGLACVIAGAAATSAALRRATAPLSGLAQSVERLGSDPTQRVSVSSGAPADVNALANEINSLLARIEAEQEQRNTFLATVSHEIRTPLAIARGQLEAWRDYGSEDPVEARRTAEYVTSEINRATGMVSSLLALARSEQPGFVEERPVLASEFAADLALRVSGIDAAVTVAPAPAEMVTIDAERLAQAILNAVTNAVIHNDQPVRVRVSWALNDEGFHVIVEDDGIGFSDDVAPEELLAPFTHGKAGTSGLGLAVIDAVARAHHGSVLLGRSRWGGGQVSISLPQATAEQA